MAVNIAILMKLLHLIKRRALILSKDAFEASATPTYIMTVNGKEINRVTGKLNVNQLLDWYNKTVIWSK